MTKTILITGANRGIGLAMTKLYLDRGDDVVAVCRKSSPDLDSTEALVITGIDVAEAVDVQTLREKLSDKHIDVLINNAGILRSTSLSDLDFDAIFKQFEVNAVGPLRVVDALRDNLKSGSKIGMITSRMGSIDDNTSGGSYGYRMSKTALNAAGKSLAHDLKAKGIAVALLHPGYVQTEMVNFGGEISPELSASRLIERLDELNLDNTGSFWHANGELLPW
ncbi:SDR family oxidoreductase [Aliikangiella marina]|uniref:SDR family oxidoreductase n=1 Tax=Aliikangiella marina TaxID=1712262 RepID=A0A545T2H4_9GAMM|nr:SDR family oxidoreductase [Aliikangiella marina]TQV71417.1 SDR family oxidoreductase [Aliikangiella marina]